MHRIVPIAILIALMLGNAAAPLGATEPPAATHVPAPGLQGELLRHAAFPAQHVQPRHVDVWLPPAYREDDATRYPVLYMHDGQNLFDTGDAHGGTSWGIDTAMARLITAGAIRPAIVVAIWNSPARLAEYMPRKALGDAPVEFLAGYPTMAPADIVSDHYLAFLVDELKPFIDRSYRTLPGRDDTFTMGSSMGGLVSLYAVSEYPQVFGGAAAVSTHWPAGDGITIDYFSRRLPSPGHHRLYFDHGTETLDAAYAPFQLRMDTGMRALGYRHGEDWLSLRFEGAEHSETSWRQRVEQPLRLLLAPRHHNR